MELPDGPENVAQAQLMQLLHEDELENEELNAIMWIWDNEYNDEVNGEDDNEGNGEDDNEGNNEVNGEDDNEGNNEGNNEVHDVMVT